jgi:hypothetical protein
MKYRCVATSVTGFVQQLASCYLPHGYWFYVCGMVPEGKDPQTIDAKLIAKYGIGLSRQARARRKVMGIANVHYLRHDRRFVLLATHGHHPFFEEEKENIRDARRVPIKYAGYSISVAMGGYKRKESPGSPAVRDTRHRVRVQIEHREFQELKAYLLDVGRRRSAAYVAEQFLALPYEPYAPVRQQLLNILRLVNRVRHCVGREPISPKVLRLRRRIVRPFEPAKEAATAPGAGEAADSERSAAQPAAAALNDEFLDWAADYIDKEIA